MYEREAVAEDNNAVLYLLQPCSKAFRKSQSPPSCHNEGKGNEGKGDEGKGKESEGDEGKGDAGKGNETPCCDGHTAPDQSEPSAAMG